MFPGIGAGSTLYRTVGRIRMVSIASSRSLRRRRSFITRLRTGQSEVFYSDQGSRSIRAQYEVKQVFYKSKDGTKVPMFIAGKKGLKRDGSERLLMTGYGGFALSETPVMES